MQLLGAIYQRGENTADSDICVSRKEKEEQSESQQQSVKSASYSTHANCFIVLLLCACLKNAYFLYKIFFIELPQSL